MAPPHPTPADPESAHPEPPHPEPSDEALIARTAAGDRAAFDALAGRHLLRLRAAADRVLGDPAAAEDVAQDALVRAWTHAGRYDPARAPVAVWLHRIAANAAIDRLRARRPTAPLPATLADAGAAADERIEARQRRRALAEAVALLPARQRAALALTYGQGRAGRDAAAALGVSARALEGLLRRGRLWLRARVEGRDA